MAKSPKEPTAETLKKEQPKKRSVLPPLQFGEVDAEELADIISRAPVRSDFTRRLAALPLPSFPNDPSSFMVVHAPKERVYSSVMQFQKSHHKKFKVLSGLNGDTFIGRLADPVEETIPSPVDNSGASA